MGGKRRGAGEGSAPRLRDDGRWEARYSAVVGGARVRRSVYGKTSKECRANLAAAIKAREAGLDPLPEKWTLSRYLDDWMKTTVKPNRAARTIANYQDMIDRRINPALGTIPLSRLKPAHLRGFLADLQAEGLSTGSIQLHYSLLRLALGHAVRHRQLDYNPTDPLEVPRGFPPPFVAKTLTLEETRAFLNACRARGEECLFTFPLIGLRHSEVRLLKWEHIDLDAGLIRVPGTKTESSKRTLPLLPNQRRLLEAHRAHQRFHARLAGPRWVEGDYVFTGAHGAPWGERSIVKRFKRLLKEASCPDIRLHDLRHSCATLLLADGVPLKTIQSILGHASLAITSEVYAHVQPVMLADALGRLDRLFGGDFGGQGVNEGVK